MTKRWHVWTLLFGIALAGCSTSPGLEEGPPAFEAPIPPEHPEVHRALLADPPLDDRVLSLTMAEAPLGEVLRTIVSLTHLNLHVGPGVDRSRERSFEIKNLPLDAALKTILEPLGYRFEIRRGSLMVTARTTRTFIVPNIEIGETVQTQVGGNVVGGGGGGGGGGGSNLSGNFTISGETPESAEDRWTTIVNGIRGLLSSSGRLVEHAPSGMIKVTDSHERLDQIEEYVRDIERFYFQQVIIEARLMEIQLTNEVQFGVDWEMFRQTLNDVQNTQITGGGDFLGIPAGSGAEPSNAFLILDHPLGSAPWEATIRALETQGKVQVLSNPRVSVLNGHTALLNSGRVVPFVESLEIQEQVGIGGQIVQQVQVEIGRAQDGVLLGVTPFILDEGLIQLHVVPMVSEIVDTARFEFEQFVQEIPILNVRQTTTTLRLGDGQTVVLGGLITERKSEQRKSLPGLGEIPVLGPLFGSVENTETNTELVVLVNVRLEQVGSIQIR